MRITLSACLVAAAFLLSACGRPPVVEIEPEFEPHVNRFVELSRSVGQPVEIVDLRVRFGATQARENGVCEIQSGLPPTVTISEAAWARLDEAAREALIFHELGHCVLHRQHSHELSQAGMPSSLMYPKRFDSRIYRTNASYYVQELFGKRGEF